MTVTDWDLWEDQLADTTTPVSVLAKTLATFVVATIAKALVNALVRYPVKDKP